MPGTPAYDNKTVATSGCGPVCMSMIVENMTGKTFPPDRSAPYAQACGARVGGGTNMQKLLAAICRDYGLEYKATNSIAEAMAAVKAGAWAIVNVGGDRAGYTGLFSDGGHYVLVRAASPDQRLVVLDPGMYPGKYDKPGRKGGVEIRGNDILVKPADLDKDAENRSPRYYLITKG